ncbi:hypothetical protein [Agromyces sp. NPDC055658]
MNDDRERDPNGPGEREPEDEFGSDDEFERDGELASDGERERDGEPGSDDELERELPADEASDPVALLRAADPAAGVEPRDGFADDIVAGVLADTAVPSAAVDAEAGGAMPDRGGTTPVADLRAERARRRPRWIAIAAVAASLAIVGGAGYAAGAGLNGTSTLAGSAAPPISLPGAGDSGSESSGAADRPVTEQAPAVGGAFDASGKMSADMAYPYGYGYGRNVFSASGLSTESGTAAGYGYDPRSASNAETVSALAAALGVEGAPELKDGAWIAGPQDGTGPSVSVGLDGTLSFWFMNPALDPWAECNKLLEGATEPAAPVEPCEPAVPDLPSDAAAADALRSLIAAAGGDPGAFEYTTDNNYEGAFTRSAQAWPVVDGQRLDQAWSIELTPQGTYSASGFLAPVVRLGDYEIVSEQEAFERLSDPRFGAQMTAMPYAVAEGDSVATPDVYTPPTEPPATPADGVHISWPVNEVEIVDTRLGLASQWQPDGSVLVVPAYEFTDADGGTWSMIAVADSELDFSAES